MATFSVSVAASGDDWTWINGTGYGNTETGLIVGYYLSTYRSNSSQRFLNVTIPPGSLITTAYVTYVAAASYTNTMSALTLGFFDTDDAAAATSEATAEAQTQTTATTSWTPSNHTAGTSYNTPSLVSSLQEVIDRAGWASGNDVVLIIRAPTAANNYRSLASWDHATYAAPLLYVEYTPPIEGTSTGSKLLFSASSATGTVAVQGTSTSSKLLFSTSSATGTVSSATTTVIDDVGTNGLPLGDNGSYDTRLGQSFDPPVDGNLTEFTVYINTIATSTDVNWTLCDDNAGIPGTQLVTGSFTPTGGADNVVSVTGSPVLQNGTTYWITLEVPVGTAADYVYSNQSDPYAGGLALWDVTFTATFPGTWDYFTNAITDLRMAFTVELLPVEGTSTGSKLLFSTSSATGTVDIQGASSSTLLFSASSATGTVDVQGASSSTLLFSASSATGTVLVQGASSSTLLFSTSSATGTVAVQGTSASTLLFSVTSEGVLGAAPVEGTSSSTLLFSTSSATGTVSGEGTPVVDNVTFLIELDTLRDGTFGGVYDDITAYVKALSWRNGMNDAYQEVAPPARAQFTIDNSAGDWRQEWHGSELLTNGDFATWTGDNPDSWTVTGESGSNPYVNEVAASELHGGTGTGYCNLYTTSAALSISQGVLTSGTRYEVTLVIANVDEDLAGGLYIKTGTTTVSKLYNTPGTKTLSFVADSTSLVIATYGACDITLGTVSAKAVKPYYDTLSKGTLVRVKANYAGGDVTQLYIGQIVDSLPTLGEWGRREVTLTTECPMLRLLDAEYQPDLLLDTTVDAVISEVFDQGTMPYPYAYLYWMLGVEGVSNLGVTTTIYEHAVTAFDTGNTTLPYAGDAENEEGKGTSAQGVIRSMMAAELGRFFFNTRAGKFTLHNRHRDVLNDTVDATYTFGNFETLETAHDDVANHITVNYEPREVGSPAEVIWSSGGLPMKLTAGERKEITARYVDPDSDKPMGAMDFIVPQLGSDYSATSDEDGVGDDLTQHVTMAVEFGGSSATVWLDSSVTCYIQILRLRGTPLRRFDRQAVTAIDGDSFYKNDWQYKKVDIAAISSSDYAQGVADWLLSRYTDKTLRLASVSFVSGYESTTGAAQSIAHGIGDRITISDTFSQHDQDYFIVGEDHRITPGDGKFWTTKWTLRPASREIYWRVGTSGYSELGATTRPAL